MVKQKVKHFKLPIKNALIGAFMALMAYWGVTLLYWQFANYSTADVSVPIEVQNKDDILAPGDTIHLLVVSTKKTDIAPANIETGILCSDGGYYDATSTQGARRLPVGSFIRDRYFVISKDTPTGNICVFRFTLDYKVNPIRTITKIWESEPFEVKE